MSKNKFTQKGSRSIIVRLKKNSNNQPHFTMLNTLNLTKKFLFSTLFISSATFAQVDVQSLRQELPQGASLGFVAKNLSHDQIVAEYNASTFMLPASTQKVFTALASKLVLGDQFQFETRSEERRVGKE